MMRFIAAFLLLFSVFSFKNTAPPAGEIIDFPQGFFASPVNHAIHLTGNFGELRPDHFHSGIDIDSKTGGAGEAVFAAATGFVSRIKVSANGYGNALYVKHPNGFTTLYAHLDRFSPEIQRFVKEKQYEKESFEVDLEPRNDQFPVNKGVEIGKLGNTGSSQGPHLHFEIRKSGTDLTLNPLLFGFEVADQTPPQLRDLKAFFLNDKKETINQANLPLVKDKTGYRLKGDTVRLGAWRVGLGLKAYDFQSGQNNTLGVFRLRLLVDDVEQYNFSMESLDLSDARYLNAHIDYAARKSSGAFFNRLFVLPGNQLAAYKTANDAGIITLYKDRPRKVTIAATDSFGNESAVTFWLLRDELMEAPYEKPFFYSVFQWNAENSIDYQGLRLKMPRGALYENLNFGLGRNEEPNPQFLSTVYKVDEFTTPVHRFFDLALRPNSPISADLKSKAVVSYFAEGDDKPLNAGGKWDGEWLTTRVRSLGYFAILLDTIAPTITPTIFKTEMKKSEKMVFRISDNLGTTGSADGLDWRATVDGHWILMEFDSKKSRLTHVFDEKIGSGTHVLRLVVRDDRGNEAIFEKPFLR